MGSPKGTQISSIAIPPDYCLIYVTELNTKPSPHFFEALPPSALFLIVFLLDTLFIKRNHNDPYRSYKSLEDYFQKMTSYFYRGVFLA